MIFLVDKWRGVPDYGEIESVLQGILGERVSFGDLVQEAMEYGRVGSGRQWIEGLVELVVKQFRDQGQTIGYLILLILSAAFLSVLAKAFQSKDISNLGFFMIYLLLSLILLKSFGTCYALAEALVEDLIEFMKVLMPVYLMAVAATSYGVTSAAYYEVFFLMLYYIQKFVLLVLLPAIRCYVLWNLLSYLGEEDLFFRARKLLKKAILVSFRAMLWLMVGVQMVRGMISPSIDEFNHTILSRGISGLGAVGNVTKNVTDVILASGVLLKNGIGLVGATLLVIICMIPVVQMMAYMLFYQVLSAVSEPVSDGKITALIGNTGDGIGLLVKLMFTICAMFLLTIAVVCVTTGGML
jgi:stage III sporulation protein AE